MGREAARPGRWGARAGWPARWTTTASCCWTSAAPDAPRPPTARRCRSRGDSAEQAAYLSHFRADSIVADCELIRRGLLGEGGQWSLLGQSFGGFCALTYLSFAPRGLREVFITGGLAGLDVSAGDVYRSAYPRVERKNARHFERYPQDVNTVRAVAAHLREYQVRLPDGGLLTAEAFQALGMMLGRGDGSHALHYLLEDAFVPGGRGTAADPDPAPDPAGNPGTGHGRGEGPDAGDLSRSGTPVLSDAFLAGVQGQLSFAGNPLYAVLHESIYGQRSVTGEGTGWAAQAVRARFPQFDVDLALTQGSPVLFTGEMIYPWMFETDPALQPLREVAQALAERTDWPDLYDAAQLARNEVPVAAAVYHDDMYVDTADSLRTAQAVRGLRTWVTDEFEHDGLRVSDGRVLDRLIRLARGAA